MIDRFEKFSVAISDLSRYWHKIAADEMEQYGLKGPYAVYFTTLYRYSEGITGAKLGELCSRDKADVSRAVALLAQKGLLKKEGSHYRALLKLSPKGMELAEKINHKAAEAVSCGGRGLSEEKRENFYEALQVIAENLRALSEQGLQKGEEK